MKKYTSIFKAITGRCLLPFLILAAAMAALETGLFYALGLGCESFTLAVNRSFTVPVFGLALLAMGLVTSRFAGPRDRISDRLALFSVSPVGIFLIATAAFLMLYIMLWALQCGLTVLFGKLYAKAAGCSMQSIWLDFSLNKALMVLIPRRDCIYWLAFAGFLWIIAITDSEAMFSLKGSSRLMHSYIVTICALFFVSIALKQLLDSFMAVLVIIVAVVFMGIIIFRITDIKEGEEHEEE